MAGTKIFSNSFACQRVSIKYKCVGYCRSPGLIIAELNFVNDHDTYDFVKRVSYNSISMLKVNVNEFFFLMIQYRILFRNCLLLEVLTYQELLMSSLHI